MGRRGHNCIIRDRLLWSEEQQQCNNSWHFSSVIAIAVVWSPDDDDGPFPEYLLKSQPGNFVWPDTTIQIIAYIVKTVSIDRMMMAGVQWRFLWLLLVVVLDSIVQLS